MHKDIKRSLLLCSGVILMLMENLGWNYSSWFSLENMDLNRNKLEITHSVNIQIDTSCLSRLTINNGKAGTLSFVSFDSVT